MGGLLTNFLSDEAKTEGTKLFSSLEGVASRSEAGQALMKIWKNSYEPTFAKTRQALTIAAQSSGSTETAAEITNKARNIARQTAFGKNDAILAHITNWAAHTHGDQYAQLLADHVAVNLQDSTMENIYSNKAMAQMYKYGRKPTPNDVVGTKLVSTSKRNITQNKDNFTKLDIGGVYQQRSKGEAAIQNYASMVLAPFIAVSHLSTPANLLFAPTKALAGALINIAKPGGYQATKQALLDTGIFNELAINTYRELQEYSSGRISQITGSPKLGYILGKAIHSPGFDALRDVTLTYAGSVAKLSSEEFAASAAKGSKYAAMQLDRMGLDSKQIISQGGRLTPEQSERAIYRYVDDHVFLQSKTGRSFYSQATKWGRIGSMYHQYVSKQAQLLRREFMMSYRSGNPMAIAKTMAMIGVAFPAVGSIVEGLEDFGRGQNGVQRTRQRYTELTDTSNPMGEAEAYMDFLAHVGGFGISASYTRAAYRNSLTDEMLGPIGNVAARGLGDAAYFLGHRLEGKKTSPKAVERDLVEDTLPDNLGKIIAHRFIPTKSEERERGEGPLRKLRMKGLKGLSSLN